MTREVLTVLVAESRRAGDQECCGLLLGAPGNRAHVTQAVPTANVHADPARHFEIDPAALIGAYRAERAGGAAVLGFYHSHPSGQPRPSATDCDHASGDGRVWAIIAGADVAFWRDTAQGFAEVAVAITA